METLPIKIIVLSSGSKGNSTYIELGSTRLLIDLGNTPKYLLNRFKELDIEPSLINAIFITHTHKDHIGGLQNYLKKYNTKIYLTEKMHQDLPYIENYQYLNNENIIGDVTINIIKTSHDASDSVGYILKYQQKKIVYITDTGYINKRYDEILKNADIYIMESNHDVQMLQNGKYPFELRKRILGDKGHLSNEDASKYLCKYIGPKTKYIFLAHLSEENNKEEIALETLKKKLSTYQIDFNNIIVAKQNEMTKEIVIRW